MILSWLYTLSAALLALQSVSSPLSRPSSPGQTAIAITPPPRAPQLHLPRLPLPLLGLPVLREQSQSKISQFTFHTPSPCSGPPTRKQTPFPLVTPMSSRLKVHFHLHKNKCSTIRRYYCTTGTRGVLYDCYTTILTFISTCNSTSQTTIIIIGFPVRSFCSGNHWISMNLKQQGGKLETNSLSRRVPHLHRYSSTSPSTPAPTSRTPRFPLIVH